MSDALASDALLRPFAGQRYINLTTFRRDGRAVATPVWFVVHEGRLYVYTEAASGKAKRMRANGRAQIAPSDVRGRPLGPFVPAGARQVREEALRTRLEEAFRHKYGWQYRLFALVAALLRRGEHVFIELTLTPGALTN
jgi:PPOX class probable F420-dependent enzyme